MSKYSLYIEGADCFCFDRILEAETISEALDYTKNIISSIKNITIEDLVSIEIKQQSL